MEGPYLVYKAKVVCKTDLGLQSFISFVFQWEKIIEIVWRKFSVINFNFNSYAEFCFTTKNLFISCLKSSNFRSKVAQLLYQTQVMFIHYFLKYSKIKTHFWLDKDLATWFSLC